MVNPKSLLRKFDFCQKRALLTIWVGNAFFMLIKDLHKVIEDLRKVIEDLRKVIEDLHEVIEDLHEVIEDLRKVMKDPSVFFIV